MSSLGIRFSLPYSGANGIKVSGNVIEIDPNVNISIKSITASDFIRNVNSFTNSIIFETNQNSEILLFNNNNNITYYSGIDVTQFFVDGNEILTVDYQSKQIIVYNIITGNPTFTVDCNNGDIGINTASYNGAGQETQIGVIQNVAITPNLSKYIELIINGTIYKLVTAN